MNDNPLKIKISVNTDEIDRLLASWNESISKLGRGIANSSAERDRRWREDPLNLMPYLRFEGVRYIVADVVADGLRAIADWIEG